MARILIPRSDNISAKTIKASDWEKYFGNTVLCDYIASGLCVTAQCPNILAVDISSGSARVKGLHLCNSTTCSVTCLTACSTNKIYMQICRDPCSEPQAWIFGTTTGCLPADSFRIANAITNCSTVTSINQTGLETNYCGYHAIRDKLYMPDALLTVSGSICANDLVMICGNLTVKTATSANARKAIGVITNAKSCGDSIGKNEIITYGVACVVLGGTVTAGDSLVASSCAGRVVSENCAAPTFTGCALGTHSHTAFTVGGSAGTSGNGGRVTSGSGSAVSLGGGSTTPAGLIGMCGTVTNNSTVTTSSDGAGTPTGSISGVEHSRVIGIALEGGTSGQTKKMYVSLRG